MGNRRRYAKEIEAKLKPHITPSMQFSPELMAGTIALPICAAHKFTNIVCEMSGMQMLNAETAKQDQLCKVRFSALHDALLESL